MIAVAAYWANVCGFSDGPFSAMHSPPCKHNSQHTPMGAAPGACGWAVRSLVMTRWLNPPYWSHRLDRIIASATSVQNWAGYVAAAVVFHAPLDLLGPLSGS